MACYVKLLLVMVVYWNEIFVTTLFWCCCCCCCCSRRFWISSCWCWREVFEIIWKDVGIPSDTSYKISERFTEKGYPLTLDTMIRCPGGCIFWNVKWNAQLFNPNVYQMLPMRSNCCQMFAKCWPYVGQNVNTSFDNFENCEYQSWEGSAKNCFITF